MKCGRSLSLIRASILLSTQRASALCFRPFGQRAPPKKQPSSLSFDSVVALRGTRCTKSEICIKICVYFFLKCWHCDFELFNWHIQWNLYLSSQEFQVLMHAVLHDMKNLVKSFWVKSLLWHSECFELETVPRWRYTFFETFCSNVNIFFLSTFCKELFLSNS